MSWNSRFHDKIEVSSSLKYKRSRPTRYSILIHNKDEFARLTWQTMVTEVGTAFVEHDKVRGAKFDRVQSGKKKKEFPFCPSNTYYAILSFLKLN